MSALYQQLVLISICEANANKNQSENGTNHVLNFTINKITMCRLTFPTLTELKCSSFAVSKSCFSPLFVLHHSPLTLPQCPAGYDPQGDHEHQQNCAWADRHQGFQHKSCVKVYSIECTNTAGACVCKELAVQEHHPAYEIEPQEHGQAKGHIHRHPLRANLSTMVGQLGGPEEVKPPWDGVDGTHEKLHSNLHHPLPCHGYPPVIRTVINHE